MILREGKAMTGVLLRFASTAVLAIPAVAAAQEFRLRVPLGLDERAHIAPETAKLPVLPP